MKEKKGRREKTKRLKKKNLKVMKEEKIGKELVNLKKKY